MALCLEGEEEKEHPMADLMNPEMWLYTKKWLTRCCADNDPQNTVRTFMDAHAKCRTVVPVNCRECGRQYIGRKIQEQETFRCRHCFEEQELVFPAVANLLARLSCSVSFVGYQIIT